MTYWVALYVVHNGLEDVFLYGYASPFPANPAKHWSSVDLASDAGRWNLRRYGAVISHETLQEMTVRFIRGEPISVSTSDALVTVATGTLYHRPPVYAMPLGQPFNAVPKSLSSQLTTVESHVRLDKLGLLHQLFPPATYDAEELRSAFREVAETVSANTGLPLTEADCARLGNFEIIRFVAGSLRVPDGLGIDAEGEVHPLTGEWFPTGLAIWIHTPLASLGAFLVRCALHGAGADNTVISDTIQYWPPTTGAPVLRFSAREQVGGYEIQVWQADTGVLVACHAGTLIAQIDVSIGLQTAQRRVLTPWAERIQDPTARDQATVVPQVTRDTMRVGGADEATKWRRASVEAITLRTALLPPKPQGRFFLTDDDRSTQVQAMDFLRDLIEQQGVIEAVIADPFFGADAVEMLLARFTSRPKVTILTSCVLGRDPDRDSAASDHDQAAQLARACDALKAALPPDLRVLNIRHVRDKQQQFHDRYLLLRKADDSAEVWHMSNSLNYGTARKHPLLITPVEPSVAADVAAYLKKLEAGQVGDRAAIVVELIWKHKPEQSSPDRVGPLGIERFPGWALVLHMLGGSVYHAVADGVLALDRSTGEATWRVTPGGQPRASRHVYSSIRRGTVRPDEAIEALAWWEYHGGIKLQEIFPVARWSGAYRRALDRWEERAQKAPLQRIYEPLSANWDAVQAFPQMLASLEHAQPWEWRGAVPRVLVRNLLQRNPGCLVAMLERGHRPALTHVLMGQLAEGYGEHTPFLSSEVGALQALGAAILVARQEPGLDVPQRLRVIGSELVRLNIPGSVTVSWLAHLAAQTGDSDDLDAVFGSVAQFWPAEGLTSDGVEGVAGAILAGRRVRPAVAAAFLADALTAAGRLSDIDTLRRWGICQVLDDLPLQGNTRFGIDGNGSENERGEDVCDVFGRCVWATEGTNAPSWFASQVVQRLARSRIQAPLLRTSDYSEWQTMARGWVWALLLGISVIENAPASLRQGAISVVAPLVAEELDRTLGPDMHGYPTDGWHLATVLRYLGRYTTTSAPPRLHRNLKQFATRVEVPPLFRLMCLLSSPQLAQEEHAALQALLADPYLYREQGRNAALFLRSLLMALRQDQERFPSLRPVVQAWEKSVHQLADQLDSFEPVRRPQFPLRDAVQTGTTFGIPLSQIAKAVGLDEQDLVRWPRHPKIQPLLHTLSQVGTVFQNGGRDSQAVGHWLRAPRHELQGTVLGADSTTPWDAICEGRGEIVRQLAESDAASSNHPLGGPADGFKGS